MNEKFEALEKRVKQLQDDASYFEAMLTDLDNKLAELEERLDKLDGGSNK